jgi:hypothetical protein
MKKSALAIVLVCFAIAISAQAENGKPRDFSRSLSIEPIHPERASTKVKKLDVTKSATDKRSVVMNNHIDKTRVFVKSPTATTKYERSRFQPRARDPHYQNVAKGSAPGFQPAARPKTRKHALPDWP